MNLSQTQIFVMDEADRILDMGFLPDLQRIINLLPKQRQNLMFSATFSPEIKKLANSFLNEPVLIEVARGNATADKVTQLIYKMDEEAKRDAVVHLIRNRDLKQVLVFSNSKIGTSRLARQLVVEGIKAAAIHGDKTQNERMAALDDFKKGEIDVLVATDVAARGLDIAELPCVINYDLPFNAEDYVHRIGRTGRAGASGDAISLYSDKDARLLADIEKLIKRKFELAELAGFVPHGRSHGRDRSSEPASPRRERSTSSASPRYSEERSRGPVPRREKVDPWFLKPYEPEAAATEAERQQKQQSESTAKPPKARVAALLGGTRKH